MDLRTIPSYHDESGIIYTGPCNLTSFLLGTDGINDPVITIYDGLDNTGTEIIPTATYDASAIGINGAIFHWAKKCIIGIYLEIACDGAVEVVCDYNTYRADVS